MVRRRESFCAIVLSPTEMLSVIVLRRRIISPPTNREDSELLSACKDHIWRRGHPFQPRRTISRFVGELLFCRSINIPASGHGLRHRAVSVSSVACVVRSLILRSWRTCSAACLSAEAVTYSESRCEIVKVRRKDLSFLSTYVHLSGKSQGVQSIFFIFLII